MDIAPLDWTTVDPWWQERESARGLPLDHDEVPLFDRYQFHSMWEDMTSWWASAEESLVETLFPSTAASDASNWEEIDPWWNLYGQVGNETAQAVARELAEANRRWQDAATPFSADPLASNLTQPRASRGPLHPRKELHWSRWLSQLLLPSAALSRDLFEVAVDSPPNRVEREVPLEGDDGTIRIPDILLFFDDVGVMIEVKIDDTNFGKTRQTAAFVEEAYPDREWIHCLLLPGRQVGWLRASLDVQVIVDEDNRRIMWDDPGPIRVFFWRDVTRAMRTILRQEAGPDDHWSANAYLFCAIAEQRIMGFQAEPVVQKLVEPVSVVDAIHAIQFSETLEEQLSYLREVSET